MQRLAGAESLGFWVAGSCPEDSPETLPETLNPKIPTSKEKGGRATEDSCVLFGISLLGSSFFFWVSGVFRFDVQGYR